MILNDGLTDIDSILSRSKNIDNMNKYKASVPGKIILTGEHAVVYGSLAIAASINIRSYISLKLEKEPSQIIIKYNQEIISLVRNYKDLGSSIRVPK